MHQIKIFKAIEPEVAQLEERMNAWLRESKARVISITGNIAPQSPSADTRTASLSKGFAPSDILLVVLYEA